MKSDLQIFHEFSVNTKGGRL